MRDEQLAVVQARERILSDYVADDHNAQLARDGAECHQVDGARRVIETPVTRSYPTTGKTPTKISPVKGNLLILRTLAAAALGKFNP